MCFSATASFISGTVLIPAGIYCLITAIRKQRHTWPLALVPMVFGIQQFSEGFVWHGIEHGDPALTRSASLVFLFIAQAFWPFWFLFLSATHDPRPRARILFSFLALASTFWFWVLFLPLATGPEAMLTTRVVHHSIVYEFTGLVILDYVPRAVLRLLYFLCVALPMVFGPESFGRLPGLVLGILAVFTIIVFNYAFLSVWCFFAAIMSAYLCWHYYTMGKVVV